MLLTEYNPRKHIKLERQEAWEEGRMEGREEGREEGHAEGHAEGLETFSKLGDYLIEDGRNEDLLRAVKDKNFRDELLKEYHLFK